jgi:hypothetical protein
MNFHRPPARFGAALLATLLALVMAPLLNPFVGVSVPHCASSGGFFHLVLRNWTFHRKPCDLAVEHRLLLYPASSFAVYRAHDRLG